MKISAYNITKYFNDKKIFNDINFTIEKGQSLVITGPNGSGKSTLIKIISGILRPTAGRIEYSLNNQEVKREYLYQYISLVSPYLELYEELSAYENLQFLIKLKGIQDGEKTLAQLLDELNLLGREHDIVKTYSSGMRQRLKYIFALLSDPEVLLLDEPTSNLDADGIEIIYALIRRHKPQKLIIIATNDQNDLKFGDQVIEISA